MRILVYLRDGRTVYAIGGRNVLRHLVGVEPWHEGAGAEVGRGTWNPTTGEYVWRRIKVRHLAKGSISHVEEETPAGVAHRQESETLNSQQWRVAEPA